MSNAALLGAQREDSQCLQDPRNIEHVKFPITVPTQTHGAYNKGYVFFLVLNATLGSLFFGYVMSAFNPINNFVSNYAFGRALPSIILNFMTSFVPLGAALGAVTTGKLTALIGRRNAMIAIDFVSIIGTVLTVIPSEYTLLIGRLIQGYCVGANSSVVPLYIKEVAPLEITGSLGTCNQLFISSGVLIAPIIGLGIPTGVNINPNSQYFRVVLAVAGIPPLLRLLINFVFIRFETPKYLMSKSKEQEAFNVLRKIYTLTRAQDELTLLRAERELLTRNGKVTFKEIFRSQYRRRLVIGILMSVFQQFSGINAIIFFSNRIFSQGADPNSQTPTVYTIIMDIVQVVTNLFSGMLVERFGRKLLSLFGMGFVTVLLAAFGIVCLFFSDSPALKFFIWGYMIGFGLSVGPLPWVIISDILPDVAVGVAVLVNWLCAFAIGMGFPPVVDAIGMAWSFLIFAITSLIGTLFILFFVKETKGKNETEIAVLYGAK